MDIYRSVAKPRSLRRLYVGLDKYQAMNKPARPVCEVCQSRPKAVAYHKYGRIYYRSRCSACLSRGKRLPIAMPLWQRAGYQKKAQCDRCGFRARYQGQLTVWHVDGNLKNCDLRNIKTVCLNCVVEISLLDLPWRRGDLEPDR